MSIAATGIVVVILIILTCGKTALQLIFPCEKRFYMNFTKHLHKIRTGFLTEVSLTKSAAVHQEQYGR